MDITTTPAPSVFNVPETIVVHLGAPDDTSAQNVTVPFIDYIKNVASSEIYPTWPNNALLANIYAEISFALNRIFTEHYRAQGYPFDITNIEAYDQAFIYDRDYFENISQIVDEIFNDYLVREGNYNPLFARYCSGTSSTCPGGLSQWGTVDLANQGYAPIDILKYYYGDDITIVENAPISERVATYRGTPFRIGDSGYEIKRAQIDLNRIAKNYPQIPKIAYPDGYFDSNTEDAVKEFQRIFNLDPDGVIGKATWYKIIRIYNAVRRISELDAESITLEHISKQYTNFAQVGTTGPLVRVIQYYLNFISTFNDFIPRVEIDGIYGEQTANSVRAFQQAYGLPITGNVDEATWNSMYERYFTILNGLPADYLGPTIQPYPGDLLYRGSTGEAVTVLQTYLSTIADIFTEIPKIEITGYFGNDTQAAVIAYENLFGFEPRGVVGPNVWDSIAALYSDIVNGSLKSREQFPGYTIAPSA